MPNVNEAHKTMLAKYGIELKKESKLGAIVKLLNRDYDTKINAHLYNLLIKAIENTSPHKIEIPSNVSFGVELEFVGNKDYVKLSELAEIASHIVNHNFSDHNYHVTLDYTHNYGDSWILGRDGSISLMDSDVSVPFGFELSSRKLNFFDKKSIDEISNIIVLHKEYLNAKTNDSCGTHIHLGFTLPCCDLKKQIVIRSGDIRNLLSAYSLMEKSVFDPIVPTSRRRNKYCKATSNRTNEKYQKLSSRFCRVNYDGVCTNLHFELRQLEGTLDVDTIVKWATLQVYIIYDLLISLYNQNYDHVKEVIFKNLFEILIYYNYDKELVNFFIERAINFKSRTL